MRLSLNKNEYNIRYKNSELYKAKQNAVSFKGLPHNLMKAISNAMDRSSLLTGPSKTFDVTTALKTIRKRIGLSADVLYEHIKGDEIIRQGIIEKDGKIQFKNKKPLRLLINGILYPITKVPFYILYGFTNLLKKFRFFRNSNWLKRFEKSSFYQITHSYMKKDDKLGALQGLMQVSVKDNFFGARTKRILQNTAKMFDSKCGNYNGVHERVITRLVTGFIPAFFLANDAYNLAILCTNNKKDAQNEKNLRFKQEIRRVGSNAYLQLITLGALSKFINKSKTWFVGVTMGTILFSEIYSRLRTGKKIYFISPKEAKEINREEKRQILKNKMEKGLSFVLDEAPTPIRVNLNGVNKFIKSSNNKFAGLNKTEIKDKIIKPKSKENSILSVSSLAKYFGLVLVAGLALKGLKKVPLKKDFTIGNIFDVIAKRVNKFYKSITMMKNQISKSDFDKIFKKMRDCKFGVIADGYERVILDYQKLIAVNSENTKGLVSSLRKIGRQDLADFMAIFDENSKISGGLLKKLKIKLQEQNLEVLKRHLRINKANTLADEMSRIEYKPQKGSFLSKLFGIKGGKEKAQELDYPAMRKLFSKPENEKYKEIFENAFAVDDCTVKTGLLRQVRNALRKTKNDEYFGVWRHFSNEIKSKVDSLDVYDLGKKKIPFVKDAIDFCIEPFKFIWKYGTLSYSGLQKLCGLMKVHPKKAVNDIDLIAKAVNTLTHKVSMSDKAFTDMFNEKIVKGFNTTTMSKVVNSELSALAKSASVITTISFRMADHYNMVMLKSNGDDVDEAEQKRKERFVQELSRFFWQQLFVQLFNNTFSHTYNASLLGASVINTADTTIGEICTRKSVSLPVMASTKEEIMQLEKDNLSGDGLKSKFFRFMSKLTGKKVLSERDLEKRNKQKSENK